MRRGRTEHDEHYREVGIFNVSVQKGEVWLDETEPAWGETGLLEGFNPDQAIDLALSIICAANIARET